ncbi:hypothetical protein PAHAL_9G171700 [Panicum hallii]|uniref:Uncharacterized protein n=1 Tax=Panicum hallii TaxID=206008 RepID=A0A2T8I1H4_9POAL|nr:hypothetical protein PAHAL_9G171700 [Panicum hallii]
MAWVWAAGGLLCYSLVSPGSGSLRRALPLLPPPSPEILAGIGPRLLPHARAAFARAPPGFSRFSFARRPLGQPNRHLESERGHLAARARHARGRRIHTRLVGVPFSLSFFFFFSEQKHSTVIILLLLVYQRHGLIEATTRGSGACSLELCHV